MLDEIRDSKKLSRKKRNFLRTFIEENADYTCVKKIDNNIIDHVNILNATYEAMHHCIEESIENNIKIDRILVDGNNFKPYYTVNGDKINHKCIVKGDDKYIGIAAASILAKTYHDDWIDDMCSTYPILHDIYKLRNNMGYGTTDHINGLKIWGITKLHRKTFCKKFTQTFYDYEK